MAFQLFSSARLKMARVLTAVAVAGTLSVLTVLPAEAMESLRKFAGIVVDAKTGDVLYQQSADDARYPASITKVMTLYILFQELSAGHLKLNSLLNVSPYAAPASQAKRRLARRINDPGRGCDQVDCDDFGQRHGPHHCREYRRQRAGIRRADDRDGKIARHERIPVTSTLQALPR